MSEDVLGIPLVPRVACSGSALRSGPDDGTSPTPADAPAHDCLTIQEEVAMLEARIEADVKRLDELVGLEDPDPNAPKVLQCLINLVGLAEMRGGHLHEYTAALNDARAAIANARVSDRNGKPAAQSARICSEERGGEERAETPQQ